MSEQKFYNARPASITNLGADVHGAARHHRDTYENPEAVKQKAQVKAAKKSLESLKAETIASLTPENFAQAINLFEVKRLIIENPLLIPWEFDWTLTTYKSVLTDCRNRLQGDLRKTAKAKEFNLMVTRYNRTRKQVSRNEYYLKYEEALKYFEPKAKKGFYESNGKTTAWRFETDKPANAETLAFLAHNLKALQFGNSVPDVERIYCAENLAECLRLLDTVFDYEWEKLAVSFGARGSAKGVAHYEPVCHMVAINRHNEGSLGHEIGHAFDYSLGKISDKMPFEIRKKYRAKLQAHPLLRLNLDYYMKNTEIFARLFEQVIVKYIPDCPEFLQFKANQADWPEFDQEAQDFMRECLKKFLKV